ncbi:MAG: type II toxin-antitoxin system HicA family toxin [Hyphomicrobiaceae bacterium]
MSPRRLPSITGREVIRALEKAGFVVSRIKGSHHRLIHATDASRATTVSVHKGRDLPRGTLGDIIEQAGLTEDEFLDLL